MTPAEGQFGVEAREVATALAALERSLQPVIARLDSPTPTPTPTKEFERVVAALLLQSHFPQAVCCQIKIAGPDHTMAPSPFFAVAKTASSRSDFKPLSRCTGSRRSTDVTVPFTQRRRDLNSLTRHSDYYELNQASNAFQVALSMPAHLRWPFCKAARSRSGLTREPKCSADR